MGEDRGTETKECCVSPFPELCMCVCVGGGGEDRIGAAASAVR